MNQITNKENPNCNIDKYITLKGSLDNYKFNEALNSASVMFDTFRKRFDRDSSGSKCYLDKECERLEFKETLQRECILSDLSNEITHTQKGDEEQTN